MIEPRRAFTMITVLWVMTVAGVVAMAAALAGRNTVNATRNRTQLERAFWIANGCAAHVRAAIDEKLGEARTYEDAAARWRVLDRSILPVTMPAGDDCLVVLEAAGTRLDVNMASGEMVDSLLRALGYGDDAASMVGALAGWRGQNGQLADTRELERVRGFEDLPRFDSVLTAEPGRVSLATAPVTVLVAVPGITRETAERIVALQEAGTPAGDPLAVLGSVSPPSANAMMAHYSDIARLTTPDPDAWILTVSGSSGLPPSRAVLEWRLVRAGRRCVVVRTRSAL